MSSRVVRLGLLCAGALVVAGAIAWAQDQKLAEPMAPGAVDVFNDVEGRTVVVSCLPEAARVEKGDIVCELDGAEPRDRLATQQMIVRAAEAEVHAARIAREVAVMAGNEYKEGAFRQELAATEVEIKLSESRLARAEDQLAWVRGMFQKGYVSMAEKVSNELALKRARFALEAAQTKKKVLIDFTKDRSLKALTGAVEEARARELAKSAMLERERSRERSLAAQIGLCKVAAPTSGRVEYARPRAPGAVVHDGEVLFRINTAGAASTKGK